MRRSLAAALVLFTAAPASAGLIGGVDLTFANGYVFRGAYVWEDVFTLHPSGTVGYDFDNDVSVTANIWAAVPFAQRNALKSLRDEIDFTVEASWAPVADLALAVGAIVYLLPDADADSHTEEIYATVGYDLPAGFALAAGLYGDVNVFEGLYFKVGPSWGTSLTERIEFSSELFYGGNNYKGADYQSVELGAAIGFSADVGQGLSATLGGLYNYMLDAEQSVYAITFGTSWSI